MTAAQWFHDAHSIYQGATNKDAVVRNIVKACVREPGDAVDLAAFLAHLQATLRDDALSQEDEPKAPAPGF